MGEGVSLLLVGDLDVPLRDVPISEGNNHVAAVLAGDVGVVGDPCGRLRTRQVVREVEVVSVVAGEVVGVRERVPGGDERLTTVAEPVQDGGGVRWTSVVLVMPQPYRQSYILSSLIVRVGLLSLAPAGCLVAQPNCTMVRVLRAGNGLVKSDGIMT